MKMELTSSFTKKESKKLLGMLLVTVLSIFSLVTEAKAAEETGPYLVLIGAPASGKTSNSKYISKQYDVPTVNVEKILQDEIDKASNPKTSGGSRKPGSRRATAWSVRNESMKTALKKLENGELVNDEVINSSVLSRLLQDDCKNGFVLDGYPGSVEQAVYLDGVLMTRGVDSLQVIVLDYSDEIALEKMAERGKAKDKSGFAEARLALYRSSIEPVLDYYQGDDLHIIDASQDKPEVQAEIDKILQR